MDELQKRELYATGFASKKESEAHKRDLVKFLEYCILPVAIEHNAVVIVDNDWYFY